MTAVVHTVTVKNGNNYLTGDLDLHSLTQLLKQRLLYAKKFTFQWPHVHAHMQY